MDLRLSSAPLAHAVVHGSRFLRALFPSLLALALAQACAPDGGRKGDPPLRTASAALATVCTATNVQGNPYRGQLCGGGRTFTPRELDGCRTLSSPCRGLRSLPPGTPPGAPIPCVMTLNATLRFENAVIGPSQV